jgi:Na+/phosphate symporter
MLFADVLFILVICAIVFFIGEPVYRLVRKLFPHKTNHLAEAKLRLDQAYIDAEIARVEQETNQIYDHLYDEALQDISKETIEEAKEKK